jgi:cytochrome c nitrite reductase small subunit
MEVGLRKTILFSFVVLAGLGVAVFRFTPMADYLTDNPAACNNCHVMGAVYEGWLHGGHREWATCNDCHTPHDLVGKYATKTVSGARHVYAFYLGPIPDAIRARPDGQSVIQANCVRCHTPTVAEVADGQPDPGRYCFDCHRDVPHGPRGIVVNR